MGQRLSFPALSELIDAELQPRATRPLFEPGDHGTHACCVVDQAWLRSVALDRAIPPAHPPLSLSTEEAGLPMGISPSAALTAQLRLLAERSNAHPENSYVQVAVKVVLKGVHSGRRPKVFTELAQANATANSGDPISDTPSQHGQTVHQIGSDALVSLGNYLSHLSDEAEQSKLRNIVGASDSADPGEAWVPSSGATVIGDQDRALMNLLTTLQPNIAVVSSDGSSGPTHRSPAKKLLSKAAQFESAFGAPATTTTTPTSPAVSSSASSGTPGATATPGPCSDVVDNFFDADLAAALRSSNHPNLASALAVVETARAYYILYPFEPKTLSDIVTFSPYALSASHAKSLFVIYQILQVLAFCHRNGITHGQLTSSNCLISEHLWVRVTGFTSCSPWVNQASLLSVTAARPRLMFNLVPFSPSIPRAPTLMDLPWLIDHWTRGSISNFEYLMALNHLAGRRRGDPNYHPVLPWVIDFSRSNGGWRNLTKTKFRLNKGDQQLDITWDSATPHHISELLSEVTYFVYLARRTPRALLCRYVRSNYEPNEYPSSMQRMYDWTPDECIPEFFTDPDIFQSIHSDMPDIEVPHWAVSGRDFVDKHMRALESDAVSGLLHHWIDLTFGWKLTGRGAVKAKNVFLPLVDQHKYLASHGVVQLFGHPHPPRIIKDNFVAPQQHQNAASLGSAVASSSTAASLGAVNPSNPVQTTTTTNTTTTLAMPAAAAAVGASSTLQQPPSNPALPSSPLPQPNTRSQMLASPTPLDIQAASASAAAALSSASATASTNSPNVSGGADGYAGGATATDGTATSSNALAALTAAASAAAPPSPPTSMPSNYPGWQMASGAAGLSAGGSSGSGLAAVSASSQQGVPQQPLTQQLPRISLAEDPDQAGHIGPLLLFEQSRAFASSLQGTSATIVTHLLESSSLVSLANRAIMEQLSQLHGQQAGSAVVTGTLGAGASEGGSLLEGASTSLAQLISSDHAGQLVAPLQPLEQLDGNILPSMQTAALLSAIGADSIPCSFEERRSFDLYRLACIVCELYLADRYHARGILEATGPSRLRTSATVDALSELDPVLGVTAPASKQRANNLSNAATISPFDTALPSFSPFPVRHTIPTAPGTTSFISQVNLAARNSVMLLNEVVFNSAVPQSLTQPIGSAEGSAANSDQTAVRQRLAAQRHAVSTKLVAAPSSAGLLAPSLVGMSSSAGSSSVNATSNQIASMSMGGGFSAAFNTSVSGMPSGKGATAFATAAASAQAAASSTLSATANTSSGTAAGSLPGATSSAAASMMMGSQGPASLYLPYLNELPSTVRQAVALLLRNDSSITPPTDLLLQTSFLPGGSFLFPDYFPALYSFLAEFQASDWPTRVTFTAEHITTLVKLADDGFQIAMPFIMQLFSHPLTRQQAAVLLFDHVTAKLGPRRTRVVFLKPLLALFELTADEAVQVVILSKRFVLSLLNRIGLSFFMEHFVGFLIDGVVSANIAIAKAAGDGLVDLAAQLGPVIPSRFMTKPLLRHLTRPNANIVIKCLLSISATGGETVVLGQYIPHIISTLAAQLSKAATIAAPSPTAAATASLGNEAGNVSGVSSTSSLVEMSLGSALAAANATIADVASPTSMADRSAQTIVNVLNLLQGCCEHLNSDTLAEQMDDFSSKVFMPLIRWLGSPSSAAFSGALRSRMCRQMLESMIYVCRLLSRKCADAMPIMKDFALPILRVFFAPFDWIYDRTLEDTTGHPRTSSASDALTSASFIAAQRASAAPNGESDLEEWRQVYTAETAYLAYSQFCLLVGQESMRRYIANSQLIETLMYSHLASFSHSGNEMDGNAEQGPGSVVSASAISAAIAAAVSAAAAAPMPPQSANDSMRAKFSNLLTLGSKKDGDDPSAEEIQTTYANWGTYLTHQMNPQSRNASLSFRELKLQSFAGHTAAVRSLAVFDNEQQFVSGSKDKTVKLWSIGMEEDSLPVAKCRRTYVGHRKTVSSVQIMTSTDFVASCDGGIHIWNPENGYCTQQFDLPKSSIVCFQQIPQRSCLVAGTSDNTLRFLDLESNQLLHEWKVATMPAGSIRSIAVDPGYNWIATGFSGGIISLLDLRTGLMLAAWRAHESDVLSMKPVSEHQLVSSSADSTLTLWNVHTAVPVKFMRGHTDAVTHFEISKRDVLALTASNRLGFHGALDRTQPSFTSHKLRSDAIRGTVNSFAMLPVNQQLLFGADSGMISLWA